MVQSPKAPPLVRATAKELSRIRNAMDCGQFCLSWPLGEHQRFWVSLLGGTGGESPIVGLALPRVGREMSSALRAVEFPQPDSEEVDWCCTPVAALPWTVVDSDRDPGLFQRLLADGGAAKERVEIAVNEILKCEAKIASVVGDEASGIDWIARVQPFAPTSSFALPVGYQLLRRNHNLDQYETKYVAYLRANNVSDDSVSLYRQYVQHVRGIPPLE